MEDEIFNKKVQRVKRIVFDNNPVQFQKTLWRMSKGSKTKAVEIAKGALSRYDFDINDKEFDVIFDTAVAELSGSGTEIEWLSE